MIVYKAYKFKLNPIEEQKEKLNQFLGTSRFIYNYYLGKKKEKYELYKKNYSLKDMKYDLKGLQKWLSRSQKGSKNRYKIILKIQEVNQKIRNARKYYTNLITKKLVNENDIIFTENLHIKEMLQKGNHSLSRRIANSSFSEIIRQLEYKAKWQNKKVIHINTYYPSSQLCNRCGVKNEVVKDLNIRKWTCSNCNKENDRDINASENILMEGLKIYFKETLITN